MDPLIYVLLGGHFFADFMRQTDWMAINKSKSWEALFAHVGIYAGWMFLIVSLYMTARMFYGLGAPQTGAVLLWVIVNGAVHFVQDAITSRWTSRLWFVRGVRVAINEDSRNTLGPLDFAASVDYDLSKRHNFFVVIGFDQLLHYVVLFQTADWWLL